MAVEPLPGSGDAPIREITEAEAVDFHRTVARQFGEDLDDETVEVYRSATELDRTFAWYEADRIMGTAEAVSFTMGMPGRPPAPCAGLTSVGVNPLRRRRGILTALMRRLTDQARERGEPFGALYASESAIYGRYGYGAAAPAVECRIPTQHGALRSSAEAFGELEMVETDEALARMPAIYDAVQVATPGMMSRQPAWWQMYVGFDPEGPRDGFSALVHVVLADRGYVSYRTKGGWDGSAPEGTLRVVELLARDPEAAAALWQLCLSMDLMATVEARQRPPDDSVMLDLVDPARAKVRVAEPLYLRLLDLPAAFRARTYAGEGDAVVEVRDAFCPWNAGTWRIDLGPDGGTATRTDAAPDLRLDVADLGAAFLGGARLEALVRARRVVEETPDAAWALDQLLASRPLPWNPRIF